VLVDEVLFLLGPRGGGWVIDGTVGMGGHAEALLDARDDVRVLGLDRDPETLDRARARLARFGARVALVHASFREIATTAAAHGIDAARSIVLDLGYSSWQLEASGRGFSFQRDDEPLDMRLDPTAGQTAGTLLNHAREEDLARWLAEYGEEPHARRIARQIVRRRPLRTTGDLVAAVMSGVPRAAWPRHLHVATRTFQAVRIAVNDELDALREALPRAVGLLAAGGRLGVIAFHSGEDRIVKQTFRSLAAAGYAEVEPSPLTPGADEVRANPRARSAKLRVLERLT
jgi:16S rRNA (cytosine1402-N4)-methyltransferase